jgi:hypothetical protein
MIHVFLDDTRRCPPGFTLARTAEECLMLLESAKVGILSLDYELGYGRLNGMAVVRGMINKGLYPQEVYVHSSSMAGRAEMVRALREAAPPGVVIHDGPMSESVLQAAAGGSDD